MRWFHVFTLLALLALPTVVLSQTAGTGPRPAPPAPGTGPVTPPAPVGTARPAQPATPAAPATAAAPATPATTASRTPVVTPVATAAPAPATPAPTTPAAGTAAPRFPVQPRPSEPALPPPGPGQDLDRLWSEVYAAVAGILKKPDWDDGSLGPLFIRLAWHVSGTFALGNATCPGGSNGATMRFDPEKSDHDNMGLEHARKFLEPIKARFPSISLADLWTFVGKVSVEEMGGPRIAWKPGRVDFDPKQIEKDPVLRAKIPPHGRLPKAHLGTSHLRQVWFRMGFGDREIVALVGSHSVGRCHEERSGFTGPWTLTPTRFNNQFFIELLKNTWVPKKWTGAFQMTDPTDRLMMLPTDMAFLYDPAFRSVVEEYANDNDLFFTDFAAAFARLLELGVPRSASNPGPFIPNGPAPLS